MKNKIKILSVFSNIDFAKEFYWYARDLNKNEFELSCIFLNRGITNIQKEIESLNIRTVLIKYNGKKDFLRALILIIRIILKIKPHIVHTQLFDASFAGLIAAWFTGRKRRISTRHHGELHHKYHRHAVKYDRLIGRLSKIIIAPSKQVAEVLQTLDKIPAHKIQVINHGFDFSEMTEVHSSETLRIKEKYSIKKGPVIGTVSRFTEWKGLHYTIRAFRKILSVYPDAILVMANATGDYEKSIENELKPIPLENYRRITFEQNMNALYKTFDVFVHVPVSIKSETFGQVYLESLAHGIPSVFTVSGILSEISEVEKYAVIVPSCNDEAIFEAIKNILGDLEKYHKMALSSREKIMQDYSFNKKISKIEELYRSLLNE